MRVSKDAFVGYYTRKSGWNQSNTERRYGAISLGIGNTSLLRTAGSTEFIVTTSLSLYVPSAREKGYTGKTYIDNSKCSPNRAD